MAMLWLAVVGLTLARSGPVTERISVTAYFTYPGTTRAEDDNPERNAIIALLNGLEQGDKLDIAIYIFTDDQIGDAVLAADQNGVAIRIFTDSERACSRGSEISRLADEGIPVRVDDHAGEMHHKFAVINNQTVITGSYNWSAKADERNWENLLVIQSYEIAADYAANFDLMWEEDGVGFEGCP
jgi:phosphatidylserine/phosphatidylglycerophosphate/cardiolipin synthase-like enzyme